MTHQLQRREFLAIASCAALAPAAAGAPARKKTPPPTVASLVPTHDQDGAPQSRCRISPRTPGCLSPRACTLTIEQIGHSSTDRRFAGDLEVLYPAAGQTHLAWSGSGPHRPAPVTTLAPTDLLGRVHLRVTSRGAAGHESEPVTREFVLPSAEGTHLIAIPMASDARPPVWRRCVASMNDTGIESIHDSWRPADAAPGCTVLRVTLHPIEINTETHSNNNTEHTDAK